MTPPLEAVRRAIADTLSLPVDTPAPILDALAVAAITAFLDAVREPSERYRWDGAYEIDTECTPAARDTAVNVWQAMIDALKAEVLPPPPSDL